MRRRGRISTPDRGPRLPWILAGLVMVVGIAVLALPPVLSADYHRAAIEALASRLTGRSVTINGRISLSLVPAPQIIADRVRIGSPRGGRISAKSLRLELAPRALLLGELRPTRVTLHAPEIVLPWPLPGGASSILPPPWLISLHAKIEDGTIALGELVFEHADLSIFIGGRHGVLAASGTGQIFGAPVDARLNIGGADDAGLTPVEAGISTAAKGQPGQGADLDFKGSVSRSSVLVGALAGYAPASAVRAFRLGQALPGAPLRFTAKAQASRTRINLTALDLAAGDARLRGDAGINLTTGLPRLVVHGHGIDLSPILALLGQGKGIPMRVRADLAASRLDGFAFGRIGGDFRVSPDRTDIRSLTGSLPGGGTFSLRGALRKGGALDGRFSLADPAPPLLFETLSAGPLPAFSAVPPVTAPLDMRGEIHLRGQGGHIRLARLRGGIGAGKGAARFTGGIVIAPHGQGKTQSLRLAVSLDFARLDVTPLLRLARAPPPLGPVTAEIALTARQARIGPAWTRDFLLDARMRHGLMVRALDFHAGRTMVTLRGARAASGAITQARLLVAGPDAGSVLALLPVALPAGLRAAKLLKSPFAAELAASGPPGKLAAAAVLHLGGARIEASPIINLANLTASGPLSLRAPYAAGVLRSLGYQAGMDWPGPGSIGLRADFSAAPHHFELPNFVLSLGALTTSGRLILDGRGASPLLTGVIDADSLDLPPGARLLGLAEGAMGRMVIQLPSISARRVELDGTEIARRALFGLTLAAPAKGSPALDLNLARARVAGGTLSGKASLDGAKPPALTLNLRLDHARAKKLAPAIAALGGPKLLTGGDLTLGIDAKASGYSGKTWEATLSGGMTALGMNVGLAGIDLGAAGRLLAKRPAPASAALGRALLSGETQFAVMSLSGSLANGVLALGASSLKGKAGSLGLSGSIDIPDRSLVLDAKAKPAVPGHQSAPSLPIALSGSWAKPKRRAEMAPASAWMAAH